MAGRLWSSDPVTKEAVEPLIDEFKRQNDNLLRLVRTTSSFEAPAGALQQTLNYQFHLITNDAALIKQMEELTGQNIMYNRAVEAARAKFAPLVKKTLLALCKIATEEQDEGAFPQKYRIGLAAAILSLPEPTISGARPYDVVVELPDLYAHLGTWADFERGFHDQAFLDSSTTHELSRVFKRPLDIRVQLPWSESQVLREKRAGVRYKAWKALFEGQPGYYVETHVGRGLMRDIFRGGKAFYKFPPGASFQATVDKRMGVWKGKAPYWLLLEYGQPHWKPAIRVPRGMAHAVEAEFSPVVRSSFIGDTETGFYQNSSGFAKTSRISLSAKGGSLPTNLTGQWLDSLSDVWTQVIAGAWAEQISKSNAANTPEAVLPYKPSGLFPTTSSESVESRSYTHNDVRIRATTNYGDYLSGKIGRYFNTGQGFIDLEG